MSPHRCCVSDHGELCLKGDEIQNSVPLSRCGPGAWIRLSGCKVAWRRQRQRGLWPASVTTVKFCGTATGGFALIGFLGLLLGIILFLVAVIHWITKKFRTRGPVTPKP
jgi:hypothetical protein